jgi:ATP-dependent DNA helicase RecG
MTTFADAPPGLREKLRRAGICGDFELALHLPLRFEDETRITSLADARPGDDALLDVEIQECRVIPMRGRRQLLCYAADDSGGGIALRFFHFRKWTEGVFAPGKKVRIFGKLREGRDGLEMTHPRARPSGGELAGHLSPVYPAVAGVPAHKLRELIAKALDALPALGDTVPDEIIHRYKLPPLADALRRLHRPPPDAAASERTDAAHRQLLEFGDENDDAPPDSREAAVASSSKKEDDGEAAAKLRLKFDEWLAHQIALRRHYRSRARKRAVALPPPESADADIAGKLRAVLPFDLTGAQRRAVAAIFDDLARPHPMARLLHGDVGSGKTVVAAFACARAAENRRTSALMAPTEILAGQHYDRLSAWLNPLGARCELLTGAVKGRARNQAQKRICDGESRIVVGTHALFQEGVEIPALALAIADEQHRFGVAQRAALAKKGKNPHLLMMSATPIPRTLSMSFFADLDVTALDERPARRAPTKTLTLLDSRREEVLSRIANAAGGQAYWVCPLIEQSEKLDLQAAEELFDEVRRRYPRLAAELIHGRMSAADKRAIMDKFRAGNIRLLIATTVIEVGVDAPEADIIVVEHAERLGLSQMHQLRGRVGRGGRAGLCAMLYRRPLSAAASERLKIIRECDDGFAIARHDLRLRGPGEWLGARQSGLPPLRFATPDDGGVIKAARAAAEEMLRQSPKTAARHTARWLPASGESPPNPPAVGMRD